jgi:N-acetylglutamate synthase-like GNAT family acetyltransferase
VTDSAEIDAAVRPCVEADVPAIVEIINDAAEAYRGVIPADRWHDPYMPEADLRREIADGVVFWGCEAGGRLIGVMGLQDVKDVTLVRHAYVRTHARRQGIGGRLMKTLYATTERPTLIGTWAAATWAIDFYRRHGFKPVDRDTKDRLLKTYWSIPARQVDTSVVLADERWWRTAGQNRG